MGAQRWHQAVSNTLKVAQVLLHRACIAYGRNITNDLQNGTWHAVTMPDLTARNFLLTVEAEAHYPRTPLLGNQANKRL